MEPTVQLVTVQSLNSNLSRQPKINLVVVASYNHVAVKDMFVGGVTVLSVCAVASQAVWGARAAAGGGTSQTGQQ